MLYLQSGDDALETFSGARWHLARLCFWSGPLLYGYKTMQDCQAFEAGCTDSLKCECTCRLKHKKQGPVLLCCQFDHRDDSDQHGRAGLALSYAPRVQSATEKAGHVAQSADPDIPG